MKKLTQKFGPLFMGTLITFVPELLLMAISSDNTSCFFHNTFSGILLSSVFRIVVFLGSYTYFKFSLMPVYSSLKDRMLDKEEATAKTYEHTEQASIKQVFSY
jgi:hypothetical protein